MLNPWYSDWPRTARLTLMAAFMAAAGAALAGPPGRAQSDHPDKDKKEVEVKTPWGGFDAQVLADARGLGLPVYPGAQLLNTKDKQAVHAELKVNGKPSIKFIVGKFRTRDGRDKVRAFYQKQLGKKVTKYTEKADDGSTVFEIKHRWDQQYVSLKSDEGMIEIDLVRIEGVEESHAEQEK